MLLDEYASTVGDEAMHLLHEAAKPLRGKRVVHVNSTRAGGGVAEILESMQKLMVALGIETSWEVIQGTANFFECTKQLHNGLQGNSVSLSEQHYKEYDRVNAETAERLQEQLQTAEYVMIHDPQPCALIRHFPKRQGKWLWRCHIDAGHPDPSVWQFLKPLVSLYDGAVFTLREFAHRLSCPLFIIPPGIDPLSPKNCTLPDSVIEETCRAYKIDRARPIFLQVSRFDCFKDPVGVIQAYKKAHIPGSQLILAGGTADDDPEGADVLRAAQEAAQGEADIKILLLPSDAHRTINALQRAATVVLQKSLKEGFGLTVTEALWKEKPVIGGNVGGIRLQIKNERTGYLVQTPNEAAQAMVRLIKNPSLCASMGQAGHALVHQHFLITRHLTDYLKAWTAL